MALVSVDASGTHSGNGNSDFGALTPDGRYVVFQSEANDLVPNDLNDQSDVFLRDLVAGTTQLISVNAAGSASGNGKSLHAVITPDGRYVAFASSASDLVGQDNNGLMDVFVRDLHTGKTTLVSRGAQAGYEAEVSASDNPVISDDGRYIAFVSSAANLVSSATNATREVYLSDWAAGTTYWVSQNALVGNSREAYSPVMSADGQLVAFKAINAQSVQIFRWAMAGGALSTVATNAAGIGSLVPDNFGPAISGDGRYVAYTEAANDSGISRVMRWDGQSDYSQLVSIPQHAPDSEEGTSDSVSMSPDGRYVAFISSAGNLVDQAVSGDFEVYVRDMQEGVTRLASVTPDGIGGGGADAATPVLSSDGQIVLFDSISGALCPNDGNDSSDVFIRDLSQGSTELLSPGLASIPAGSLFAYSTLDNNALSADGRYVLFESYSDVLAAADTNGMMDVFVRDRQMGANILVSVNAAGTASGNGASYGATLSADGRYVVFLSAANDLVANTTNAYTSVFVRDLVAGTTRLVSATPSGGAASGSCSSASVSADGKFAVFWSSAANGIVNTTYRNNVFLRDLEAGATFLAGSNTVSDPVPLVSANGRFVSYHAQYISDLYVLDAQTRASRRLTIYSAAEVFSVSGDKIAFLEITNSQQNLVVADLAAGTRKAIALGSGATARQQALGMSADGRWVAVSSAVAPTGEISSSFTQVYLCDMDNANVVLVSARGTGNEAGNGASTQPRISADGRFVTFRSEASDLVADDYNGQPDIFLFDRLAGSLTLLSRNAAGLAGNGRSVRAEISGNAQCVAFTSAASDLVNADWNSAVDVFSLAITPATPSTNAVPVQLSTVTSANGQTTVSWSAAPGKIYRLQYSDTLAPAAWQDLFAKVIISGEVAWAADSNNSGLTQRFYRVRIVE